MLRTGSRYAERLVTHDATFRFLAGLRVWLFRAAIPLAPARLEEQRGGDLLNRMTADVDSLDAIYLRVIVPSIVAGIAVLLVGGVLLWLAPAAAAIVVALALLVGIALPLAMRRIGAAPGQAIAAATARLRTRIVEGVQGLAELKVYQADGRHAEAVLGENETLMAAQRRMARLSGISTALSGLAGQLAALAILALGVAGVAAGVLPGPAVALMMLGALALFDALVPLPLAFQNLGRTRAAARRLLDFAALEPLVRDPATPAAAPAGNALVLSDVSYRYRPGDRPALTGIDLVLAEGQRVAVLGPSGSGKSTLAALILRFRDPDAGSITLGGTDLRALPQAEIWRRVAYLSQRSQIFAGTIRDNLLIGAPEADDATLAAAVEAAGLAGWVAGPAARAGHLGRRGRHPGLRRPGPAHRPGALHPEGRADPGAGRADRGAGRRDRGPDHRCAAPADRRSHHPGDHPPAGAAAPGRKRRADGRGPHRRAGRAGRRARRSPAGAGEAPCRGLTGSRSAPSAPRCCAWCCRSSACCASSPASSACSCRCGRPRSS